MHAGDLASVCASDTCNHHVARWSLVPVNRKWSFNFETRIYPNGLFFLLPELKDLIKQKLFADENARRKLYKNPNMA